MGLERLFESARKRFLMVSGVMSVREISLAVVLAAAIAALQACGGASPDEPPSRTPSDSSPSAETSLGVLVIESSQDLNPELYALDIHSGRSHRLTNHPSVDNAPDWSPDGASIAFQSQRDGDWAVYLMDADGTDVVLVASGAGFPDWSPDGARIVFSAGDARPDIYLMDRDGGVVFKHYENFGGILKYPMGWFGVYKKTKPGFELMNQELKKRVEGRVKASGT